MKKGDSLIEVILAVAIFSAAAVSAIGGMSFSLFESQSALEVSMARNEIDAQAEALRFIHDAYVYHKSSDVASGNQYSDLWQAIIGRAIENTNISPFEKPTYEECKEVYDIGIDGGNLLTRYNSFAIDIRALGETSTSAAALIPALGNDSGNKLVTPSTFPRLVYADKHGSINEESIIESADDYDSLYSAEGIWVYVVPEHTSSPTDTPGFYDFYINTCWNPAGRLHANTISTTIRLFNPDIGG